MCVFADPGNDGKGDLRRAHGLRQAAVQAVRDQRDLQRHRSDSHERCSSKTRSRAADMCNKLIITENVKKTSALRNSAKEVQQSLGSDPIPTSGRHFKLFVTNQYNELFDSGYLLEDIYYFTAG